MTAQDLKNSILQLAIQGKLVEQKAEEGTTKELLEQIKTEKERLIKEKKIKKEKLLPEISEDEIPFEIPESWEWVRIGMVCNVINGFTPKKDNPDFWDNGDIPWFTIADIRQQGRFINNTEQYITEKAVSKESERIIPKDSVLVCCTASVGECAYTNISLTTNQQFNGMVIKDELKQVLLPLYLYEFSKSLKTQLMQKAGKTTINFVSVTKLMNILIPIPPYQEQKRIVRKIEELLPYVEQYDKAYSKLEIFNKKFPEDMSKSILQYAIQGKLVEQRAEEGTAEKLYQQIQTEKETLINEGKIKKEKPLDEISEDEIPFEIPESWKWVRFSEICNISDGTHQTPTYVDEGRPFISAQNVKPFKFMPETQKFVSEEDYFQYNKNVAPEKGDILLTRVGAGIGESAIIDIDIEFSIYVSLCLIKCYLKNYDMKYLMYVLNSPYGRKLAEKKTLGKSASQGNLNLVFIREYLVPLAPLEEQKRIVQAIEELLPFTQQLKK